MKIIPPKSTQSKINSTGRGGNVFGNQEGGPGNILPEKLKH